MTKRRRVSEMSLLYTSVLILRVGKGNADLSSVLREADVCVRSGRRSGEGGAWRSSLSSPRFLDRRALGPDVRPGELDEVVDEDRPRSCNTRHRKSSQKTFFVNL